MVIRGRAFCQNVGDGHKRGQCNVDLYIAMDRMGLRDWVLKPCQAVKGLVGDGYYVSYSIPHGESRCFTMH